MTKKHPRNSMAKRFAKSQYGRRRLAYPSVDKLQKVLTKDVFHYAKDSKKASGRALGTLVEIVTFYTLCAWQLRDATAIEASIPEFANPDITHKVEFSVHPIMSGSSVDIQPLLLPLTIKKLAKARAVRLSDTVDDDEQLISSAGAMRNATVVDKQHETFTTAHVNNVTQDRCTVTLTNLLIAPYSIFECKRVGVEEGQKKGPQTIEKAKQGAYVARSVSSLQKFRLSNGKVQGVLDTGSGKLRTGDYDALLRQTIDGTDAAALRHFILTVGVVSNHGNWFTGDNPNKEIRVLAHSYDWLLFLTDNGLAQFIDKLLLHPVAELKPARDAFLASYPKGKGGNRFTKVRIDIKADEALKRYFKTHESEVEGWFNVIAPRGGTLNQLQADLVKLASKDWGRIRHS